MTKIEFDKILKDMAYECINTNDVSVDNVQYTTSHSCESSILFYFRNEDEKSNEVFKSRIRNSKYAYLITNIKDEFLNELKNVVCVDKKNWLEVQRRVLDVLYPISEGALKLIGITGTNGKTTTVDLLLQIATMNSKKAISVGTLGVRGPEGNIYDFGMTTPPYIEIRKLIHKYSNYDAIFFEVSSHALEQERFYKLDFDECGWTSFSRDHLDYHKSEENYFNSKLKIISHLRVGGSLFVPWREEQLYERLKENGCVRKTNEIKVEKWPLFFSSKYNRSNLELAHSISESIWKTNNNILIEKIEPPPGRFKVIESDGKISVIDFAHTPDAIENICSAVKEAYPQKNIWVLFGCGGDRDRGKRPLMGKASENYASKIFLTSDNPRSEDPLVIIKDIKTGINEQNKIVTEADRSKCIKMATRSQSEQEILLVLGKGHENYIEINGIKTPYSDEIEILKNYGLT